MPNYQERKEKFPTKNSFPNNTDLLETFKCPKCGMPLFSHKISKQSIKHEDFTPLINDAEEKGKNYRIKECPNCHYKFTK